MNDSQAFLMPSKIAMALIGRSLVGTAPLIIGTTALIAAGSIYGIVKGTKAIKQEIDKPRPGDNNGAKLMKSGATIKSITMSNSIFDEFSRQAKKLGVPFAACTGASTTNIIFDEKHKELVDTIRKDVTKQHALAVKAKEGENPEKDAHPLFREVDLQSSRTCKAITMACDILDSKENCETLVSKLEPMTRSITDANGQILLELDPAQADAIKNAVDEFNISLQTEKVALSPEKSSEIYKMVADIATAARNSVENNSPKLPQSEKDKAIAGIINNGLRDSGIQAEVSVNGRNVWLHFDPKDKISVTSAARQHNKQVALGEHLRNTEMIRADNEPGLNQLGQRENSPIAQQGNAPTVPHDGLSRLGNGTPQSPPKLEVVKSVSAAPAPILTPISTQAAPIRR